MPIEESLILDVSAALDAIRNDLGGEIDALPKRLQDAFADLSVGAAVEVIRAELGGEIDGLAERLQASFTDLDVSSAAAAIRDEIGAQIEEIPGQLQMGFESLDVSAAAAAIRDDLGAAVDEVPVQLQLGFDGIDVSGAGEAIRTDIGVEIDQLPGQLQRGLEGVDVSGAAEAISDGLGAAVDELPAQLQQGLADLDVSGAADAIRTDLGAAVDEVPVQLQTGFDGLDVSVAAATIGNGIGAEIDALPAQLQQGLADVDAAPAAAAIRDDFVPVLDELGQRLEEAFTGLEDTGAFQGLNDAVEKLTETMQGLGGATEQVFGQQSDSVFSATDPGGAITTLAAGTTGLGRAVSNLGGAPLLATASLGAAFGIMTADALDAASATASFNLRVGDLAVALNRVDVAGLNESLSEFAIRIGADDDAMRLALARLVDMSVGSNKTREEVGKLGQEFTALAGYLSLVNPSLGTADQLLQSLPRVLARGGPALANYGVSLTATAINQQALTDNVGKTVEELTTFDKASAGLKLTMDQLGPSFDANFTKALEDPKNQMRAMKTAIAEAGEAAALPILEPLVESLQELTPSLIVVAETIGTVGAALFSVLGPAIKIVAPVLEQIADLLDTMPEPLVAVAAGVALLGHHFGLTAISATAASVANARFAATLPTTAAASAGTIFTVGTGLYLGAKALGDWLDKTRDTADQTKALLESVGTGFAVEVDRVLAEWRQSFTGEFAARRMEGEFQKLVVENIDLAKRFRDEWAKDIDASSLRRLDLILREHGLVVAELAATDEIFINAVTGLPEAFGGVAAAAAAAKMTEDELATAIGKVNDMVAASAEAAELAGGPWREFVDSMTDAEGAASRLTEELFGLSNTQGEVSDSFIEFAQATKDNGASLDLNTQAGRRNEAALQDLISKGTTWIAKIYESEGASINFARAQAAIRDQLENVLRSLGYNEGEIAKYIAMWDLVPGEVETNVVIKISTVFVGASKGEEQKYFDQLAEAAGDADPQGERAKRIKENLYDMTPPADTKAKTAQQIKDFVGGVMNDVTKSLADSGAKAGGAAGKALAEAIPEALEWNEDKLYSDIDDWEADLADFMVENTVDPMEAYAGAIRRRGQDVLDALREVNEGIISQARYDSDTLSMIFKHFGEDAGFSGGPGDVPLNLDIDKLAKGFTTGGVDYTSAVKRMGEAFDAGLIDQVDIPAIIGRMVQMYIDAANKTGNQAWLHGIGNVEIYSAPGGEHEFTDNNKDGLCDICGFDHRKHDTSQTSSGKFFVGGRPPGFARGGITEPGIYDKLSFAESGTGGEAFIPLGSDRRTRATAILGEVASRFGYSLIGRPDAVSVPAGSPMGSGSLERIAELLESLPERLPRSLSVTAPIDNVSYGDSHDVAERVVHNVARTLAGIGVGVSTRQGRR